MVFTVWLDKEEFRVEIGSNFTTLDNKLPLDMGRRYRLDTAARMLAGVLKEEKDG